MHDCGLALRRDAKFVPLCRSEEIIEKRVIELEIKVPFQLIERGRIMIERYYIELNYNVAVKSEHRRIFH